MHSSEKNLAHLARLARRAPDAPPTGDLPRAIATRVLAQLRADEAHLALSWERLAIRSVPLAAVAAAICLYFGGRTTRPPEADEQWLVESIVHTQLEP